MADGRAPASRWTTTVLLWVLLVPGGLLAAAPPVEAAQDEVSYEQLQELARRAQDDPAALERLRRVGTVDGQPVDLGLALGGPEVTRERLRVLAGGDGVPLPPDAPAEARRQAGDVLEDRRFQPRRAPRPFRGVLRRLGGWLRPVAEPPGRFFGRLFGSDVFWALTAAVVFMVALIVSVQAGRRRSRGGVATGRKPRLGRQADPDALEKEADEAERRGQLDRAFRLRFLAGLLRLDQAGHLPFRPSLTTGEVVRTVPSATLSDLASTLEDIVYAGRPARPDDLDTARSGWPEVLREARRLEEARPAR